MSQPLMWIAVPLMLIGAVLLVAGVGAAGLWIAVIAVGIALVAINLYRRRQGPVMPDASTRAYQSAMTPRR